jgi:2,3,4,5-tetrahydropyridine-2-carboxylate N-succinyltransferase
MQTGPLEQIIDDAFERRAELGPGRTPADVMDAVDRVLSQLNAGTLRVAEKIDGTWTTRQWLKKAVLLYFRVHDNHRMQFGGLSYFDKVPAKFEGYTHRQFRDGGLRVVPPAMARAGSFIAKNVVLMPSFVNIGAYVGPGTMVDTWATVGSCAQIGKNVHLAGGVGIGGVLEPPNAVPVVIGDEAFISSRCMVVEGARVGTGAVLGAGTILTRSSHVIDVESGEELARGKAPAWSVCVGGTRMRTFAGGEFGMPCVLVLKRLPEGSRHDKAVLNGILRDHGMNG